MTYSLCPLNLDPEKSAVSQERLQRAGLCKEGCLFDLDATRLADDALSTMSARNIILFLSTLRAGSVEPCAANSEMLEKARGRTWWEPFLNCSFSACLRPPQVGSSWCSSVCNMPTKACFRRRRGRLRLSPQKQGSCFKNKTPAVKLLTDRGKKQAHATNEGISPFVGRTRYIDADQHLQTQAYHNPQARIKPKLTS